MGSIAEPVVSQSTKILRHEVVVQALEEAVSSFTAQLPRSKQIHDEACKYMPGGNTRTVLYASPFPLAIESGQSCHLTTADNHTYVDFLGEYTAGIFGHSNPIIRKAVEQALDNGWNYGGQTTKEQELAKIVCERFPPIELVRFVNSGTEATMMALATAVAYTSKHHILIFNGSYHGGTISGNVVQGKPNINLPHKFVIGSYNDQIETQALVDQSPDVRDDLAAILVEPMIGSGGCLAGEESFLRFLRELATEHNAVLIFDEVMTSRLSYHGLAHKYGIKPDMMTIGKWIGGGMSFGAFGGRADLMQMYDPRTNQLSHPGTFNNNVFTMIAGIAGCEILTETRLFELNMLGEELRSKLTNVFEKHGIRGRQHVRPLSDEQWREESLLGLPKMFVTGVGSIMNIHFSGNNRHLLQDLYYYHMLESGIYMAHRGFIALSLELNKSHVDQFVEATDAFCQRWQQTL